MGGFQSPSAGGITKLSQLVIDADKDWNGKGFSNLKEVVAAMDVGAVILKGLGGVLVQLPPGVVNRVLTSHGLGALPDWQPGGTYYNRYYPVEFYGIPTALLAPPDGQATVVAPLTRDTLLTNDAPTKTPSMVTVITAAAVVPDGSAAITGAMATAKTSTLRYRIIASADDCYQYWTGAAWSFATNGLYTRVGYTGAAEYKGGGGFRFLIADIPNAAVIDHAYLWVRARVSRSEATVKSYIQVEDADDATAFTTQANYAGRARVSAPGTAWDAIAGWTVGTRYQSPDFAADVQHVINHAGWNPGQHLVVFWHDEADLSTHAANTMRETSQFDDNTFYTMQLEIQWH